MTARAPRKWKPDVQVVDLADRTPPHNVDAEAAVIAHVLHHGGKALDELSDLVGTSQWYVDANRRIFEASLELHRIGQPVDLQTVAEKLRQLDWLQAIGGISYLSKLLDSTPAVANLRAHAEIVVDLDTKRRAIEACKLAAAEGYLDTGPTLAWLDTIEQRVHDLSPARQSRGVVDAFDLMSESVNRFCDPRPAGIPTGLADLDEVLGGMRDGELIVIAGRPGMGKTACVTGIAMHVAAHGPKFDGATRSVPLLASMVFSLEMPAGQMGDRMLCSEGRIDLGAFRKKSLPAGHYDERLVPAATRLSKLPIYVDDTSGITLMELRAKVRRKQREFDKADGSQKLGVVIVDYLQLMRGDGEREREQEIAGISRGLKAMAKELKLPVVALSQLNRAVETRSTKDKRPQLSDLRESGAIEQDADAILFTYRPEYYIADKHSPEALKLKGYAEVIVAKQRNGPTGRVPVTFIDHCARFENRSRDAYQDREDA